jgi:ankyrin repeat protein
MEGYKELHDELKDACQNGNINLVKTLFKDKKQILDAVNDKNQLNTYLHLASDRGHKDIAELLIEKGANINQKVWSGNTPLHCASLYGHKEIVELLIANGATFDEENEIGETPLHFASAKGHKDIVKLLIENGANINQENEISETPLHWASENGHNDIAELLIEKGANINKINNYGLTPLHMASFHGRKDIAQLLIENGANVNEKDNNGYTPLHSASENGHEDIAQMLIANGANVFVENNHHKTPFDCALEYGYSDLVKLFIDKSAKLIKDLLLTFNDSYYESFRQRVIESLENKEISIVKSDHLKATSLILKNLQDFEELLANLRSLDFRERLINDYMNVLIDHKELLEIKKLRLSSMPSTNETSVVENIDKCIATLQEKLNTVNDLFELLDFKFLNSGL